MLRMTAAVTTVLIFASTTSAHYLWITTDNSAGEQGVVNLYFEGGPAAGDGQYLDPFVSHGKSWVRSLDQTEPAELKMEEVTKNDKRWLTGKLPSAPPHVCESYGKWGVYRYGDTDVLLHYYAKSFDISSLDQLEKLARSANLDLDLRPNWSGDSFQLQVFWQGTPAAKRSVAVRGPKGFKANLKTDDKGLVSFQPQDGGRYTLRTSVELKQSGTDDGKEYQLIRHNATLLTELPSMDN